MIIGPMIFIYFILNSCSLSILHHNVHNIYFQTHGKYSNPQAHHLSYDVIIRNHETLFAI